MLHRRIAGDGGYAFPIGPPREESDARTDVGGAAEGAAISLRDWFAGQALAGVLAKMTHDEYLGSAHVQIAEDAYHLADAMLAQRRTNSIDAG